MRTSSEARTAFAHRQKYPARSAQPGNAPGTGDSRGSHSRTGLRRRATAAVWTGGPTSRHHSHCGRPHTSRCVPRLVQLPGPVGTRDARQNQQLGSLLSALAPGFDNPLTQQARFLLSADELECPLVIDVPCHQPAPARRARVFDHLAGAPAGCANEKAARRRPREVPAIASLSAHHSILSLSTLNLPVAPFSFCRPTWFVFSSPSSQ